MPRSLCDGLVGSARQPGALVMCHQDMTCCITSATISSTYAVEGRRVRGRAGVRAATP